MNASPTKVSRVCWIAAACFALLVVVDSAWSTSIPAGSLLRMAAPALICALLFKQILVRRRLEGGRLMEWTMAIVAAGAISSAFCDVPILGFIKLGLYVSVLVPLLLTTSLHRAFDGRSRSLEYAAAAALALVLLNIGLMPITKTGMFDNANKAGMFAVCVWPLMAVFACDLRKNVRLAARLGIAACLALCAVAWSRAAVASVLAGLVMYASLRKEPTLRSVMRGVIVAGILGAVSYYLAQDAVHTYALKGRTQLMDGTRQFMFRETLLHVWEDSPLLGYGFGLSWTLRPDDVDVVLATGRMSWFTVEFGNSMIAILSGGGILLLIAFLGLFACMSKIIFQGLQSRTLPQKQRDVLLAMTAGIACLLVHAQAEAWLMAPLNWSTFIFWFYVGLAVHVAREARRGDLAAGALSTRSNLPQLRPHRARSFAARSI